MKTRRIIAGAEALIIAAYTSGMVNVMPFHSESIIVHAEETENSLYSGKIKKGDSGVLSGDVKFSLDEKGVLTISGNGEIPAYGQGNDLFAQNFELHLQVVSDIM